VALFYWRSGPASLALMQRETTAAGWVTPADFADAVAPGVDHCGGGGVGTRGLSLIAASPDNVRTPERYRLKSVLA